MLVESNPCVPGRACWGLTILTPPMPLAMQVASLMGHYGALKSRVASYHAQLLAALEPPSELPAEVAVA